MIGTLCFGLVAVLILFLSLALFNRRDFLKRELDSGSITILLGEGRK